MIARCNLHCLLGLAPKSGRVMWWWNYHVLILLHYFLFSCNTAFLPTSGRLVCWIILSVILTFISPLVAYYVALHHFNVQEEGRRDDQQDEHIWESRLIAFGVMIGLWFVMFLPVVTWKYMGRVRMNKMIDGWAKDDVRTATSYAAIPTWKVTMPGVFKDDIVLVVSCPAPPSNFDYESYLPPYIATPPEAAPSYEVTKRFSSLQGNGKFGEIPLYSDNKDVAV